MKKLRKNQKLEAKTPVMVFWKDPATVQGGWRLLSYHIDQTDRLGYAQDAITIGGFVHITEKYISVGLNFTNNKWDTEPSITEIMEIPLAVVKEIYILE